MSGGRCGRPRPDCGSLRPVDYRVTIQNTKYGPINAYVKQVDTGYVAFVSGTEYPDLPVRQTPPGSSPLANSVEEAVEQLRRALT